MPSDEAVGEALGEPDLRLSLWRAPYGRPMYPHDRRDRPETFAKVVGCMQDRSVHVGWTMTPTTGRTRLPARSSATRWHWSTPPENGGILLMHSIWQRTCDALPAIIDGIRARGFASRRWRPTWRSATARGRRSWWAWPA